MVTLLLHLVIGPCVALGLVALHALFAAELRGREAPHPQLLALALTGASAWLAFRITSGVFARVRRGAAWDGPDTEDVARGLAAALAVARAWTLLGALPGAAVALWIAFGWGFALVAGIGPTAWAPVAYVVLAPFVLGWVVARLHRRASVRSMEAEIGVEQRARSKERRASGAPRRRTMADLRVRDAREPSAASEGARAVLEAGRAPRRLDGLRQWAGPLAALVAFEAWLRMQGSDVDTEAARVAGGGFVAGVLLARLGAGMRLADRSPVRELRLGAGALTDLLALGANSVLRLVPILSGARRARGLWRTASRPFFPALLVCRGVALGLLLFTVVALVAGGDPIETATWTRGERLLPGAALALASWAAVHAALTLALRPYRGSVERFSLVFLRVFGDPRRARFVFSEIAPRWRWLGNCTCIAAPDVSIHQHRVSDGLDALFGQVEERFQHGGYETFEELRQLWLTPVGGARISEVHCFADTWRGVLKDLMVKNSVVLMDLRGFGPANRGCEFELRTLVDAFPLRGSVFLADESTDLRLLETLFREAFDAIAPDSPNAEGRAPELRVLRVERPDGSSARGVVAELCEAAASRRTHNTAWAKAALRHVIEVVQLLAADPADQLAVIPKRGGPKAVLVASLSCGPEIGQVGMIHEFKLLTDEQRDALHDLSTAADELGAEPRELHRRALEAGASWAALRSQARAVLRLLGGRLKRPTRVP